MIGRRAATALCLAATAAGSAGCSSRGDRAPTPAVEDARATPRAEPAPPPAHPLAGRWTGHQMTRRWGVVSGVAEIDRDGRGTGVVTTNGLTFSAVIAIQSWNGRLLELEVDGVDYRLPGSLAGDRLRLEVPMVGEVTLQRGQVHSK